SYRSGSASRLSNCQKLPTHRRVARFLPPRKMRKRGVHWITASLRRPDAPVLRWMAVVFLLKPFGPTPEAMIHDDHDRSIVSALTFCNDRAVPIGPMEFFEIRAFHCPTAARPAFGRPAVAF